MKNRFLFAPCAVAVAIAFGATMQIAQAARGGRGGGGGFSRESPAASGSLSSRRNPTQGRPSGAQANRQQPGASAHASRQQSAATGQANRSSAQANHEQTATGMKSNAQQYHDTHIEVNEGWDAGTGLAVATGAAIGAAVVNSGTADSGGRAAPATGSPYAAPTVVSAGNMTYFGCGSLWYTEAYGPSGPTFVQVAAPSGY